MIIFIIFSIYYAQIIGSDSFQYPRQFLSDTQKLVTSNVKRTKYGRIWSSEPKGRGRLLELPIHDVNTEIVITPSGMNNTKNSKYLVYNRVPKCGSSTMITLIKHLTTKNLFNFKVAYWMGNDYGSINFFSIAIFSFTLLLLTSLLNFLYWFCVLIHGFLSLSMHSYCSSNIAIVFNLACS